MVTASHNPRQDNGYKVYWGNGSQIIPPHDDGIAAAIQRNAAPWAAYDLAAVRGHELVSDPLEEVTSAYYARLGATICRHREQNRVRRRAGGVGGAGGGGAGPSTRTATHAPRAPPPPPRRRQAGVVAQVRVYGHARHRLGVDLSRAVRERARGQGGARGGAGERGPWVRGLRFRLDV